MIEGILASTKDALGIEEDLDVFDNNILILIGSAFATLRDLGIGPKDGFEVDANTTWAQFLEGNLKYNQVKTYVYLQVRLVFDPPSTGYLVEAYKAQLAELVWRISVVREETEWVDPNPLPPDLES